MDTSQQMLSSDMSDVITAQPVQASGSKSTGKGTISLITRYWKYILFAIVFVGGLMYYMRRKRLKCSKGAFASLSNFLGAKRSSTRPAPSIPVSSVPQPQTVSEPSASTPAPTVAVPDTTDPNFTPLETQTSSTTVSKV